MAVKCHETDCCVLTIRAVSKNPADSLSLSGVNSVTKMLAKNGDEITRPVERDILPIRPAKCMNIISKHYMAGCIDKSGADKVLDVRTASVDRPSSTHTHMHA